MEEKEKQTSHIEREQTIHLVNQKDLEITDTKKVISLKPDIIQLTSSKGGMIIDGKNLELIKLDDNTSTAHITGEINQIRFVQTIEPKSIFRKIFK